MNVVRVPCSEIKSNPRSPGYPPQEVEVLARDIDQRGLLRPILLRKTDDGYVIVHGERRWRAAMQLGHPTIVAYPVADLAAADLTPA